MASRSQLQPSVAEDVEDSNVEHLNSRICIHSNVNSSGGKPPTQEDIQLPRRLSEETSFANGEPLQTLGSVIATFLDHIECAIHTILYERDIYPRNLFMNTRKYDCPVKMCRVAKVNEYVRGVVELLGDQLLAGKAKVISILIISEQAHPLERFNFDVSSFPEVEKSKAHSLLLHEIDQNNEPNLPGTSIPDLGEQFRAVMTSLSVCSGKLGKLPKDCTWTVMVETKEGPPVDYKNSWVVADRQPSENAESIAAASRGVKSTPLRTVESGAFSMEVWIEESNIKLKLPM